MTAQKAIQRLKAKMGMSLFDPDTGEALTPEQLKEKNEEIYEVYLTCQAAAEALEKQIPIQPIMKAYDGFEFSHASRLCCPNCKQSVINYFNRAVKPPYCMLCGQKLDLEGTNK